MLLRTKHHLLYFLVVNIIRTLENEYLNLMNTDKRINLRMYKATSTLTQKARYTSRLQPQIRFAM